MRVADHPDVKHADSCHSQPNTQPWPMEKLKARAPEIGRAFGPFFQEFMKQGALSVKQKELIAVGIAVAIHCEPCVDAHVEKCLKAGAAGPEIMEAAGVGVLMGGGPAYMYSALVAAAMQARGQPTGHFRRSPLHDVTRMIRDACRSLRVLPDAVQNVHAPRGRTWGSRSK